MKIITIFNNKGGVGKTTVVSALGAELVNQGKKVLLLDLDTQANLSYIYASNIRYDIGDVLNKRAKIIDAIYKTRYENLFIMPSKTLIKGGTLKDIDVNIIQQFFLSLQKFDFDFIIVDTAPTYNQLIKNIISNSTEVIPVVKFDSFSTEGIKTFFILTKDIKYNFNKIIFNCRDKRIKMQNDFLKDFNLDNLKSYIVPIDNIFVKAQYEKKAVQEYSRIKKDTKNVLAQIAKDLINEYGV